MKQLIFLLFCFFFLICKSQEISVGSIELEILSSKSVDIENKTSSIIIKLTNKSLDTICFWLDNDLGRGISDSLMIKNYFFSIKGGGDASIYQIGFDGNVSGFTPKMYINFIKKLTPNQFFYFEFIDRKNISSKKEKKCLQTFIRHIRCYNLNTIEKVIPDIRSISRIIYYNDDSLLISLKPFLRKYYRCTTSPSKTNH